MKKSIAALFAASISAQQQFLQEYGDALIGVIEEVARTLKAGGKILLLCVSATSVTPRIQEAHTLIAHGICELVEQRLFGAESSG